MKAAWGWTNLADLEGLWGSLGDPAISLGDLQMSMSVVLYPWDQFH